MRAADSYDYAVIRVVPRVEREEFVNVGIVLSCERAGVLRAAIALDEARLRALDPQVDMETVRRHLDAIVAVSFLACALAMTNAATRLAFAMSREGLLPPMFGVVSRRGVPARGGIVLAALVTAVPLAVLALGGTREAMRAVTSPASVVGFILAYALLCAAAPVFLARIGELTAPAAVLAALPLIGLTTVLAVYLSSTSPEAAPGLLGALASPRCSFLARRSK